MKQGEGPCYHNWDCCASASQEMVCYGITKNHGGTCRVLKPLKEGGSEGEGEGWSKEGGGGEVSLSYLGAGQGLTYI